MYDKFLERTDQKKRSEFLSWLHKSVKSTTITEKQFDALSTVFLAYYIRQDMDRMIKDSITSGIKEFIAGENKKHHDAY